MEAKYLDKLAEFFKVFGDKTRLNILKLLLENEMNVGEISAKLDMNSSAISHQLRILRTTNLVKTRKDGKEVFYSLSDDHVKQIYKIGLEHVMEWGSNNWSFKSGVNELLLSRKIMDYLKFIFWDSPLFYNGEFYEFGVFTYILSSREFKY